MIRLLAVDDFLFADWGIPPAIITKDSSHMGFGVERRAGIYGSVFFGATASPATWNVLIRCGGDEAARQALIAVLAGQRSRPFRLLAQRLQYGQELITTEAAVTGELEEGARGEIFVNFESNDSVWLAEDTSTTTKTFASPLDQVIHLDVPGNVPTNPVVRITPLAQRSVTTPYAGWRKRRRYAISNEGTDPLFRYEVMIDLGNTAALVAAGKARADGADLRVWLHGLEQSRSLVGWNTASTKLWVVVPVLPPRQSLTYDVVYGNPLATSDDGVDLVYPELPAHDITAGSNFMHVYRNGSDIDHAGQGLWPLSSPLEGGAADYGVPGAWQPALTWENPNNTDSYVQPRSQRMFLGDKEWYQANLYASRWRGPGFEEFQAYEGTDPFDGVTLYNPFGVRSVQTNGFTWRNDSKIKTVVTTTVGTVGDETTESTEVLAPHDPPYTRIVVIGRNNGGEGWHVLTEYGATVGAETPGTATRLFLPGSGRPTVYPTFAAGWNSIGPGYRILATLNQQFTSPLYATVTGNITGTANQMSAQFIYPLPAGVKFTTTDTVKAQIAASTQSGVMKDARAQMCIRVMTAESVVQATLLDFDNTAVDSTNRFAVNWDTNRKFPVGGVKNLIANYTTVAGDYLVMEFGARKYPSTEVNTRLVFEDRWSKYLTVADATLGDEGGNPFIEFSTDLNPPANVDTPAVLLETAWTPPSPVKHFGIACWPQGVSQIPDDAESRAWATTSEDITVHIAAESLLITEIEAETDIYELATELRVPGGGNAVGPYHALLVGNARQQSGPGTPRAAIELTTEAVQIDTERRTHTVWDPDFLTQHEALSTHAVRALSGGLRQVDATDIPSLTRTAVTIPNADFASNITGWASHSGGSGWTKTAAHDPDIGGAGLGSIKFAVTSATAGTWLYQSSTAFAVEPDESVDVTAWMHQSEAGASSPRLGVAWYDGASALISDSLDAFYGIDLDPAQDRTMRVVAKAPVGAVTFRVLLGVTVDTNAAAGKWFDDVTATVISPQRYDASLAKITEEMRASRWLPLVPPRRFVVNGAFDADISSWALHDGGTGITHTASHDATIGGYQNGSLKIAITANSGSDEVVYVNSQVFSVSGQESETVAGWVRTSNANLVPRLCLAWYIDPDAPPTAITTEDAWTPAINTGYRRAFGAVTPPEVKWFRLGLVVDTASSATGNVWLDDVTLNDNELFLSDVSPASLDVDVIVRPRFIP